MAMTHRQFNRIVLGIAGLMVGALVALNISVDPFGMFGTSPLADGPSSNERFIKIEQIRKADVDFELLILGSSRSGMTDPAWLEEVTGLPAYNLSAFSARPSDMLTLYKAYRSYRPAPRMVMVGIDAMGFLVEPEDRDLSRRHHPSVAQTGGTSYWLDYLLAPSVLPALEKISLSKQPNIRFDWHKGTYALPGYEREIAADAVAYREKTFSNWAGREFASQLDRRELTALNELLAVLDQDAVEFRLFLQPMHRQWKERMAPLMIVLSPELERFSGMVDLSGIGSDDDEVWFEQRHYREPVARAVVRALFDESEGGDPMTVAAGSRRVTQAPPGLGANGQSPRSPASMRK